MTSDDRHYNLMFLMALAPLAAGCPGDDAGTTGATTTPGTSSTTGATETTAGTDTTGGAGSGETTAGMDTTEGTETGSEDTTAGLVCEAKIEIPTEIDPLCEAAVEQENECYYDGGLSAECIAIYEGYCQYGLEYSAAISEACLTADAELLTCATALSCEELPMLDQFCADEVAAKRQECGGAQELRPSLVPRH